MHNLPKIYGSLAKMRSQSHLDLCSEMFYSCGDRPFICSTPAWLPSVSPLWLLCSSALSPVLAPKFYVGCPWWGFLVLTGLLDHTSCPLPVLWMLCCFLQWTSSRHEKQSDCPPHLSGLISVQPPWACPFPLLLFRLCAWHDPQLARDRDLTGEWEKRWVFSLRPAFRL